MSNNNRTGPKQMPEIDINTLKLHECPDCKSSAFIRALELRLLPFIVSPSGQNEILQKHILICVECKKKVWEKDLFETIPSEIASA